MELSAKQIKKYQKKTITQLIKLATEHFNRYIRQRDDLGGYFQCISCGEPKSLDQMNASHYMAAGNYSNTRFNEDNVHGACIKCNKFLHGNLIEYRKRLVQKIGLDRVEFVESIARKNAKQDRLSLIYVIETYKDKCK